MTIEKIKAILDTLLLGFEISKKKNESMNNEQNNSEFLHYFHKGKIQAYSTAIHDVKNLIKGMKW